jgi:tetratricopeptide (TPR) repeat protein
MNIHKAVGALSFLLFILLQSNLITSAQDAENFVKGNHFFTTGRYELACDAYQKIENKGFAAQYNLGLSYLHQDKRGQAILACKRAEKHANFKELTQLYELFDCMHRQIDPDYVPTWYDLLAIFVKKCILSISMLLLQIVLLFTIVVLMICWYRRWLKINKRFLCMAFFSILLLTASRYKTDMLEQQIGIVTKNLIPVFAGPDDSFYKKAELHESDAVTIIGSQSRYYQVQVQQVVGWIHDYDIELV